MSTVPVPRAAGLPGEVGNTLALRHALGGRSLLSEQGTWCPNLGPQDLIWVFPTQHQRVGDLGVRCGGLGYSMGVRHHSERFGFGVWGLRCRTGELELEDFGLQS